MSLYRILLASKLNKGSGGGGGFTPTDEQLAAMNSGITATKLTQDEANIAASKAKTDRIIMDDEEDALVFIQADTPEAPEGYTEIPDGSLWFSTEVST